MNSAILPVLPEIGMVFPKFKALLGCHPIQFVPKAWFRRGRSNRVCLGLQGAREQQGEEQKRERDFVMGVGMLFHDNCGNTRSQEKLHRKLSFQGMTRDDSLGNSLECF